MTTTATSDTPVARDTDTGDTADAVAPTPNRAGRPSRLLSLFRRDSDTRTATPASDSDTRDKPTWRQRRDAKRQANLDAKRQNRDTPAATPAVSPVAPVAPVARPRTRDTRDSDTNDDKLPNWMRHTGTWLDRLFGAAPLVAPLAVSGWLTYHVGTIALGLPAAVAVALSLSLEGGLWRVGRLYERALLRRESTIALRIGMLVWTATIGGAIYWHTRVTGGDWRVAVVVGGLAGAGVWLWIRQARDKHRERLHKLGLVDGQATKFSILRWLLCPLETPKAFRFGIKYSLTYLGPDAVLDTYRQWCDEGKPRNGGVAVASAVAAANDIPSDTSDPDTANDSDTRPATPVRDTETRQAPATPTSDSDTTPRQDTPTATPQRHDTSDTTPIDIRERRQQRQVVNPDRDTARRRYAAGDSCVDIASDMGVAKRTVERWTADLRQGDSDSSDTGKGATA